MFTRCPTCHTTFAVTEAHLAAKEGLVRCGHCTQVFNASWNLIDLPSGHTTDPAVAAAPTPPPPAREKRRPSSDPDASPFDSHFSLLDDEIDTPSNSEWSWTVPHDKNDNTIQPKKKSNLEDETDAIAMDQDEPISIMPPTLDELIATAPDEEIVLDASDLPGKTDNLQARAFLATEPYPVERNSVEKEKSDGLDEASSVIDVDALHISVDSSLSPQGAPQTTLHETTASHDYRMPPRRRLRPPVKPASKRGRSRVAWSIGSLLVTLLLVAQISYFYFYDLSQMATTRPYVAWVCGHLGCNLPPRQNVSLIDLVKTQIAYRPEQPQMLRIQVELVNRADYFQRLPLVEASLTNRHGQTVARRTYSPDEYLPYTNTKSRDMTPGVTTALSLTVARPDDSTVGYEIQLLPEPAANRLGPSQFNASNPLSRFASTLSQLMRSLLQRLADLVG